MQKIKEIPVKELVAGVTGHYVHGEGATFGYVELTQGSRVPDHSHVNEQITYILEGQLQMVIGGQDCLLEAGMFHVIKSGVVHNAFAVSHCKLIDVFTPVREEYK
jgi:quercetin dioxygenase-like cupin family protein